MKPPRHLQAAGCRAMMRTAPSFFRVVTTAVLALSASPAFATFHFMQIEQVIGGVDGDKTVQAIQLRSRGPIENQLQLARMRVFDAAGGGVVIVDDPALPVANGAAGARILFATANFAAHCTPAAVPNFIMDNPIPAAYLTAGSLTFEDNAGSTVYWRLSWGGAGYTGPTEGSILNDDDGNYGPPYANAIFSADARAVRFLGTATDVSTTNLADYALTTGQSVWTNNAGNSFTLNSVATDAPVVPRPMLLVVDPQVVPNPFTSSTRVQFELARAASARLVIVDAAGRRIGEVARALPAGTASMSWNGRDASGAPVAAGVYFYRLEVGGDVKSGQMLLIR